MRQKLRVAVLTVGILTAGAAGAEAKPLLASKETCRGQASAEISPVRQERALRCLINRARSAKDLRRLKAARRLHRSADRKSRDMIRCQDFSHTACGRYAFFWMVKVKYATGCWGGGENIAWGTGSYATARETMRGWLQSPPHRRVLLTRRYRSVGLGLRTGSLLGNDGAQVWTAHFGYRC